MPGTKKTKQSFRDWFVIVRIFKVHWKSPADAQRFRHYYALGVPPLIALRWEDELRTGFRQRTSSQYLLKLVPSKKSEQK